MELNVLGLQPRTFNCQMENVKIQKGYTGWWQTLPLYSSQRHQLKPVPDQQICKSSSYPEHNRIPSAISERCKYNSFRGLDYKSEEEWQNVLRTLI